MSIYIEADCVIEHEGKQFEARGASVTPDRAVAYMDKGGVLTDWKGNRLGTYSIKSTWKTPRSYVSSVMHQLHATINGVLYTGRCAGVGMIFNGRRMK